MNYTFAVFPNHQAGIVVEARWVSRPVFRPSKELLNLFSIKSMLNLTKKSFITISVNINMAISEYVICLGEYRLI